MKKIIAIMTMVTILLTSMNVVTFASGESDSIVSSSYGSTYVIKNDGSLWGWGGSYVGADLNNEKVETPTKILENVRSVSSNSFSTVAVKKDDTLWGWGFFEGQLNGKQRPTYLVPTEILDHVEMAAQGSTYTLALKNDHTLWLNGKMLIGDGTNTMATTGFVQVMSGVKSCVAGEDTVFIIKEDDSLWGWGDNSKSQLANISAGQETNNNAYAPVKILEDVKYVTNNSGMVLAIRLDGSLYTWGGGSSEIYTQDGWLDHVVTPYKVMDQVVNATMCDNTSGVLVVKTDGSLWGWNGQWYDEGDQMAPYQYGDNVSLVSNGERHAAVVKKDNTLWVMGGNYRGGLGYDSDEIWYTPLTKVVEDVQDAPATWAMEEVEKAIGQQLIPQDMQSNYTKAITRKEFCILAIRMIEVKSGMSIDDYLALRGLTLAPSDTFIDTTNKEVLAAKTLGITDGTSENTFTPDTVLKRQEAAKFLSATAEAVGKDITANVPSYSDLDQIANWAKPYIGYVYNIGVMKGVGANNFSPKGSYQRQQAFMTMYRIWKAIDEVTMEPVAADKDQEMTSDGDLESTMDKDQEASMDETMTDVSGAIETQTIAQLKTDIEAMAKPEAFTASISGTSTDSADMSSINLKYDMYYKGTDIRIDTYWFGNKVAKVIYNTAKDATYTEMLNTSSSTEYLLGNYLPIRTIGKQRFEELQAMPMDLPMVGGYTMLDGQKVMYLKWVYEGVTTETWYSLQYFIPMKFHQKWLEDGGVTEINWKVDSVDVKTQVLDSLFDIPSGLVPGEATYF